MKLHKGRVFAVIFVIALVIGISIYITNKNKKPRIQNLNLGGDTVYENSIRLGISNFDTINPILTNNKVMININQLIYEPLFEIDSSYKLQNCLAKEIAKTSANTYILKVDNSIKWSNGSEFTAKDVKFTIDTIKAQTNIFFENVKDIVDVSVIDDSTLKISLSKEIPFFEYNLTFPIICQNDYTEESFYTSTKTAIGTGKYKVESINGNQIILEKNSEYHNNGFKNEKIEKIIIIKYSEIGEVYNGFKLGNIDVLSVSGLNYKNYIGTLGYYAKDYIGREYDFLSFNCNDNILKNVAVRQAISYAIDKDNIISNVYNNEYYKANYPLDYGNALYSTEYYSYDCNIDKAKEILINNGWQYYNNSWWKQGIMLRINLTVNSSNKKRIETANVIKQQLETIGISVNIREVSDADYNSCLINKNYQVILTGVYNGYSPDLEWFYGENNIANYSNEDVVKLLNEVRNITDEKLLKEKYEQIVKLTSMDCAYVGICRNKCSLIVSRKMSGNFQPNNFGIFGNFESWNRER